MSNDIKGDILSRLQHIEQEENVCIFYACEAGSRAWGFPSANSDYDVRFLYIHPKNWYLSIDEKRDVIEQPGNDLLDISGWDIRKALRLFRKSNPPLLEWINSPIIYQQKLNISEFIETELERLCATKSDIRHIQRSRDVPDGASQDIKSDIKPDTAKLNTLFRCVLTDIF